MRRFVSLAVRSLTLCASMVFAWSLRADIVYLNDGTKIEGEVVRKTDAGWVLKTPDGKVTDIEKSKIKSFEAKRGNVADEPMQALTSLRRSVESQTDIKKVLERYKKFVEQHIGTPAADEAAKDIQTWQDRLDQGMVRIGEKWVTKAEQDALGVKGMERAIHARKLLLQGRTKDAVVELDSALTENPHNAAAQYLRGLVYYRQDQKANARKSFEGVLQLVPNHGPSMNNIAVLMWEAKQIPASINEYGQAMTASPNERAILDNVAEALHALPQAQRDNAATKKVVLMFNAQDMSLQGRMKKRGLTRWGSTWVEEKALKDLKAEEDKVEQKIDQLESDFEDAQDRIEELDRDIADTERSIRRIEASVYGRDGSGRPVRLSYPRIYYELKHDLEQLVGERDGEKETLTRLRKKAKELQQQVTVPRFTGVQHIIGVEGAPDMPSLADEDARPAPPAG
jgi:tetratricopeptide (TPR) repeat protein